MTADAEADRFEIVIRDAMISRPTGQGRIIITIIMRPSSLGGAAYCVALCPSVCLSVRPVSGCTLFTVAPSYERTFKIETLRFSLMGQRHVCTFRHAQRAAYRTAISAAQILVYIRPCTASKHSPFDSPGNCILMSV